MESLGKSDIKDNINLLCNRFRKVFQDELPPGLPPKIEVELSIEIDNFENPPHRPSYHLPPVELVALKSYVVDLLKKKHTAK